MLVNTDVECIGCGVLTSFTFQRPSANGRRVERRQCPGCNSFLEVEFTMAKDEDGDLIWNRINHRSRVLVVSPVLEELMKETEMVSAKVAASE